VLCIIRQRGGAFEVTCVRREFGLDVVRSQVSTGRETWGTHYKRAPLSSKLRLLCEAVNLSKTKGTP